MSEPEIETLGRRIYRFMQQDTGFGFDAGFSLGDDGGLLTGNILGALSEDTDWPREPLSSIAAFLSDRKEHFSEADTISFLSLLAACFGGDTSHSGEAGHIGGNFSDDKIQKIEYNNKVTPPERDGKEVPQTTIDAETAEAVKLLRHQMHPPDISDRPKFRGARVEGIRASEFFDKHYGELKGDIDSSTIISHDKKLYDLLKAECHREGKPLTRFMRTHRDSLNQRRDAIAKVLGVPSHTDAAYEIYNFFSGIRER